MGGSLVRRSATRLAWEGRLGSVLVATIIVAGGVVAAVSLLVQQWFPNVSVVAGVSTQCGDPTRLTANATQVIAGTAGYIRYRCGTGPAFSALAGAVATPRFDLTGTVFTKLYIYRHSTPDGTTCLAGDGALQITNNQQVAFPLDAGTTWDYCGRYVDAALSATTAFNITWWA
jgi:hypothetical protein